MTTKKLAITALIVLMFAVVAACGKSDKDETPSTPDTTQNGGGETTAADAEKVYQANCIGCHATDLAGGVGPNLQKVGGKLSSDEIKTTIANGRGGMPAFKDKLSDTEITALSSWLAEHK
ncbi:c-type cytochrome [Paenibacillus sp. MMS18-CY102]|uniref:c-type cytochrome n=1 Tax=Paenibacillus sp. MMS18-CY102 TaxID=2682849 RepID=UPI0013664A14|nr:cytochrome c [Paenibacillus sp. MMS18-CY102]MWC27960.1 c-type cytochrome [Paenibacillus sp. MMS18-CY102]